MQPWQWIVFVAVPMIPFLALWLWVCMLRRNPDILTMVGGDLQEGDIVYVTSSSALPSGKVIERAYKIGNKKTGAEYEIKKER